MWKWLKRFVQTSKSKTMHFTAGSKHTINIKTGASKRGKKEARKQRRWEILVMISPIPQASHCKMYLHVDWQFGLCTHSPKVVQGGDGGLLAPSLRPLPTPMGSPGPVTVLEAGRMAPWSKPSAEPPSLGSFQPVTTIISPKSQLWSSKDSAFKDNQTAWTTVGWC